MKFEIRSIFVKTLLIVLATSFVLFGIINFFNGVGNSNILKINKQKIGVNQFSKFLNEKRNQFFNTDLSSDEVEFLNSKSFINTSLSEFTGNILFQAKIDELNLNEPKEIVVEEIYNDPNFKNKSGFFDLELFKEILKANNLTEDKYIQYISKYNARNNLLNLITSHNINNNILLNKIFKEENKYITVDIIFIKPEKLNYTLQNQPSKIEIEEYYNNNKNNLITPETRIISYIDVDLSKYTTEEAKNKLSNLEDLILSAKNLDEIVQKFNSKKQIIKYNENNKLIPDDLNKEILYYNAGTFSDLIYKDNNIYRVYYVEKIIPTKLLSLDEATPDIVKVLKQKSQKENEALILDKILTQLRFNDIKQVVLRNNFKLKKDISIYKNNTDYPDDFVKELYKIKKEQVYTKPIFDDQNNVYLIGFVKDTNNIPNSNINFTSEQTLDNIWDKSYKNSIIRMFNKYLFDSNKVIVNNKVLDNLR
ncbi:MAG TPA: peptidylprolyl isomerase [Rickettsiales bacterium]|nr:peptidylprolyl isomerase [Rickettsiales bacterium]